MSENVNTLAELEKTLAGNKGNVIMAANGELKCGLISYGK